MGRVMGLFAATVLLWSTAGADPMDDEAGDPPGTHQGRVDNIIEMLENDADPNDVIPEIYNYVDYYLAIGYQNVGIDYFAQATNPPGVFAEAYAGWERRLRLEIRDLLRNCDPQGLEEAIAYLEFYDVGYGPVITLTWEERVEQSEEFGAAYKRWKWRDEARDLIDKGDGEDATDSEMVGDLLDVLTDEQADPVERLDAAGALGAVDAEALAERFLLEALQSEDSLVRFWAATMVGRRAVRAGPFGGIIVDGLQDHSWPARQAFARALLHIGGAVEQNLANQVLEEEGETTRVWPARPHAEEKRK